MQKIIFNSILVLGLLIGLKSYGQCPPDDEWVNLYNQADVNAFAVQYPNCTAIQGTLQILGLFGNYCYTEDPCITSLAPLQNLTYIGGNLIIRGTLLTDLSGLDNIQHIGGGLDITENNVLQSLNGLNALETVGFSYEGNLHSHHRFVDIVKNYELQSLEGLSSLHSVAGYFRVMRCHSIQNLIGISSLKNVLHFLITANDNLQSFEGLTLENIGYQVLIEDNAVLSDITGLENINLYGGLTPVYIFRNPNLSVCNVPNLCYHFKVYGGPAGGVAENAVGCDTIPQIVSSCPACPDVDTLVFSTQQQLINFLEGHPTCTDIPSNVIIGGAGDTDITDLSPLSNIVSIGGNLSIFNNPLLENLGGLENLETIDGNLSIGEGNTLLSDITALSNLTSINGSLEVLENPALENLTGLHNIDSETITGTGLRIVGNGNLSFCNLANFCYYISNSPATHPREISGNAEGCIVACCPSEDINISAANGGQQALNQFIINYPACEHLDVHLLITGNNLSPITDLSPLENIKTTTKTFHILLNLGDDINDTSLEPLQNLTSVGGNFSIRTKQPNLNGLQNLTSVGGYFEVSSCANLTDLSGMENLVSVGGEIRVKFNSQLTSLNGLQNVDTSTLTGLILEENPSLSVCSIPNICEYLQNGGTATIFDNATDCNTLVEVMNNCGIIDACPPGSVTFSGAGGQEALNQFILDYPYCTEINGNVIISGNTITDLGPLHKIVSITGDLTINSCINLLSLEPLENLESVGGALYLSGLTNLPTLNGLHNITSVKGINVSFNAALTDLQGLEGLTDIGDEFLYIANNNNLVSLSGLQNVDMNTVSHLYIQNHPNLSTCYMLPNICVYLHNGGAATISDNTGDCLDRNAVENACPTIWDGNEWNIGVPDQNRNAIIEGDLTTDGNLTTKNITVNSGVFVLADGNWLTVHGIIENTQNTDNFIIQSGANLIQVDDVQNIGEITVQRDAVIKHLDYTIWSSPVAEQGLQAFSPYTLPNRIRIYDGTLAVNTWVVTSGDFAAGKGYMFRAPNVFDDGFYPNAYTWTGNFKGIPQNGPITAEFTNLGNYQSIGNPYPSNINRDAFHTENPNIGALYFWTNSFGVDVNGNYLGNNWKVINILGESVSPTDGSNEPVDYIAVGQGFLARTYNNEAEVLFNNQMRTTTNATFYKVATTENHKYWLNLQQEIQSLNQMLVSYNENSTNELDFGIDSSLLNYSGSALYSLIQNSEEKFAIQGRALPFNPMDIVPLGFKAIQAGSYTISLSNFDGLFAEGQEIYLRDKFTQVEHDLKTSNYDFVSEQGTFNERFEVIYTTQSLSVNNPNLENSWIVYKNENSFNILTHGFELKDVVVYDMLGRVVYAAKDVNSNQHQFNSLGANQVLIVKVSTVDGQNLAKKIHN